MKLPALPGVSVELDALPERFRPALAAYLATGQAPPHVLMRLLEGDVTAVAHFEGEMPELAALVDWMARLPAQCWGSRDQVQVWTVYARRAHGRAALAAFERGMSHAEDAEAEARRESPGLPDAA
jgi:hypothetical protein